VPRFYFDVTTNGAVVEDCTGTVLADAKEARNRAIDAMPGQLAAAVREINTYVAMQIFDENKRTVTIVRASIVIETLTPFTGT
jgi:hypothetical protein